MDISPTGWIARYKPGPEGRHTTVVRQVVAWNASGEAMVYNGNEAGNLVPAGLANGGHLFLGLEQVHQIHSAIPAPPGWRLRGWHDDQDDTTAYDTPIAAWIVSTTGTMIPVPRHRHPTTDPRRPGPPQPDHRPTRRPPPRHRRRAGRMSTLQLRTACCLSVTTGRPGRDRPPVAVTVRHPQHRVICPTDTVRVRGISTPGPAETPTTLPTWRVVGVRAPTVHTAPDTTVRQSQQAPRCAPKRDGAPPSDHQCCGSRRPRRHRHPGSLSRAGTLSITRANSASQQPTQVVAVT